VVQWGKESGAGAESQLVMKLNMQPARQVLVHKNKY